MLDIFVVLLFPKIFRHNYRKPKLGVDLEVEGVRYIEIHRGPAAYVLGPPPSRSRDLELEGGVIACHVDYVYEGSSPKTPTCEVPSNGVVEIRLLPIRTGETSI